MAMIRQRRRRGSTTRGRAFGALTVQAVWQKGRPILFRDPAMYRRDVCGNIIYRSAYGKESPMGWEIDHRKPVAKGGTDHLNNLQPLQSAANAKKGDRYPWSGG